ELVELKRITADLHALIDSERASAGAALSSDRRAFKEICDQNAIDCHVLDLRATENYMTEKAIRIVKGDKYRQLGPFEELRTVTPAWAKHENWRIALEMDWGEVKDTDLGQFLAAL